MAHAHAQLEAGLRLAQRHLGHDFDRATALQVRQRRGNLFLDLRLAGTAFRSLPTQGKWLSSAGRRGTGGSYQDQNRPERDWQAPEQGEDPRTPWCPNGRALIQARRIT